MSTHSLSVLICAYTMDRLQDVKDAVASVQVQTRKADEIFVIVDYNEELYEALKDLPVTCIRNSGPKGLSGGRNTGTETATGDIVVYLDDDATAATDWLEHIAAPYEDENIVAVGGWATPQWDSSAPAWFPEEFNWVIGCSHRGLPERQAEVRNLIGCNMSFRRQVVLDAGGFDDGLGRTADRPLGCEETELCIRVKQQNPDAKIVLEPSAKIRHRVPNQRGTWKYFVQRCRAEGNSKAHVVGLVGDDEGLKSERTYLRSILPAAAARAITGIPKQPVVSAQKFVAIVGGVTCTVAGYSEQKVRQATTP